MDDPDLAKLTTEMMFGRTKNRGRNIDRTSLMVPKDDLVAATLATLGSEIASVVAEHAGGVEPLTLVKAGRILGRALLHGAERCDLSLSAVALGPQDGFAEVILGSDEAADHPVVGPWIEPSPASAILAPVLAGALATTNHPDAPLYREIELRIGPDGIGDNAGVTVRATMLFGGRHEAFEATAHYGLLGHSPAVTYGARIDGDALFRLGLMLREPILADFVTRHAEALDERR